MSLLLLQGRKIPTVIKTKEVPNDYAIWVDSDANSQKQKTDNIILNTQPVSLIKNQLQIPILEENKVQFDNTH